jgi:hypothetical protein
VWQPDGSRILITDSTTDATIFWNLREILIVLFTGAQLASFIMPFIEVVLSLPPFPDVRYEHLKY